jgi:hypothetical protein
MSLHKAVLQLYSTSASIIGNTIDELVAYDTSGNEITLDKSAVANTAASIQADYDSKLYQRQRELEYPDFRDYLDGIVKGDQTQIQAYITACQAVKTKYPKPT